MHKETLFILLLVILASLCDTINQLCLKSSINTINMDVSSVKKAVLLIWKIAQLPLAWLALCFSFLSLSLWLFVLTKAPLSFAYALDSIHYVFIALASCFILKEDVSPKRWLGTLLIMAGIVLVSLSR